AHFQRGLEALERLADRSVRAGQELRLLIALGPALMMTRSSIAPEIARTYARARQLASQLGQTVELFTAVWGLQNVANVKGELETGARLTDELFEIAERQEAAGLLLQANHAAWGAAFNSGDVAAPHGHATAG